MESWYRARAEYQRRSSASGAAIATRPPTVPVCTTDSGIRTIIKLYDKEVESLNKSLALHRPSLTRSGDLACIRGQEEYRAAVRPLSRRRFNHRPDEMSDGQIYVQIGPDV